MSEELPAIETRPVRALERAGLAVVRIKGSAHIMRHANGRMLSVHVHKGATIKRGTLAGIRSGSAGSMSVGPSPTD